MALINLGNDPWLLEYEACDKLQREIMEQLSIRNKETKSSEQYSRLSATIRVRLKQFNAELRQLKIKLEQESKSRSITLEEFERRTRQVELLQSQNKQMQKLFENYVSTLSTDRRQLMGRGNISPSIWQDDDELIGASTSDSASIQNVDHLKNQQQKMIKDQEKGLEELSKIISRQKNIATTVSNEVDLQNDILDNLGNHIEQTDTTVLREIEHIQIVNRVDRTCGYWVVIIILFIAIIVIACLNL